MQRSKGYHLLGSGRRPVPTVHVDWQSISLVREEGKGKMSSKYDAYWSSRLTEIARLLAEAYRDGVSSELDASNIRQWGDRRNWYGAVEVSQEGVIRRSGAHARSLGEIAYGNRLIDPYGDVGFRMVISRNLSLYVKRLDVEETMPRITVSKEMHKRLEEFKRVVEAVLEEDLSLDDCAETILGLGIDYMLDDLLGPLESTVLLRSFQQLGAKYPVQVYRYIAETLKEGAAAQEQEAMRRRLGFRKPS